MYDLLIKGGHIIDGSGLPGFRGDLAIKGTLITRMGRVNASAAHTIDAGGLVVAPGFVDIHTHYDAQAFWDPLLTSSSWNGVTTVVMGNCGFTLAPCKEQDQDFMTRMLARVEAIPASVIARAVPFNWRSFEEFLASLEQPRGINVATMVGHSAIRYYVMGESSSQKPASAEQIDRMRLLVGAAIEAGAFGFSTSQSPSHWGPYGEPVPSRFATLDEIRQLSMSIQEFGNGTMESVGLANTPEGRDLLIELSLELGRPVNWNEWNQMGVRPTAWKEMMEFMEAANRQGAQVYGVARCQRGDLEFDLKENSLILFMYPNWRDVLARPIEERMRLLAQAETRQRLHDGLEQSAKQGRPINWEKTAVWEVALEKNRCLEGRTIDEISREQRKNPMEALIDLALEEGLGTEFAFVDFMNDDEDAVRQIIQSPYAVVGISDGGAHLNSFCGAEYSTYLLSKWVRERQALTLEEAIRKLTFMPASLMGFRDRGLLREGMVADITIFDPKTVAPHPKKRVHDLPGNDSRLVVKANGLAYTVVGGEVLFDHEHHTGALPGRLLRSGEYRS